MNKHSKNKLATLIFYALFILLFSFIIGCNIFKDPELNSCDDLPPTTFSPTNKDQLIKAIASNGNNADLNYINTSNITDMASLFQDSAFNGNISCWDTGNVTVMYNMFYQATNFNQDIPNWDTSKVNTMAEMFYSVSKFNGDLSGWDTGSVETMEKMFYQATNFNQDISKWDTSHVGSMLRMFKGATKFNQNLSKWVVTNVTQNTAFAEGAVNFTNTAYHPNWCSSAIKQKPNGCRK